MLQRLAKNFTKISGSWTNLEDYGTGDLPAYKDDEIFLNNKKIGEFNPNNYEFKFESEAAEIEFNREISNNGIKLYLKDHLKIDYDEMSPKLIVAAVVLKDLEPLKELLKEPEKMNPVKQFITGLLDKIKNESPDEQANKLDEHRKDLKRKGLRR